MEGTRKWKICEFNLWFVNSLIYWLVFNANCCNISAMWWRNLWCNELNIGCWLWHDCHVPFTLISLSVCLNAYLTPSHFSAFVRSGSGLTTPEIVVFFLSWEMVARFCENLWNCWRSLCTISYHSYPSIKRN